MSNWNELLTMFACAFTRPSFELFITLCSAWILCPGRHTITHMISVTNLQEKHSHDAYHGFIRCRVWSMGDLWDNVARLIINTFASVGDILIAIDDTLIHKSGYKIEGVGIYRDAVHSTARKTFLALGLNLVVLTIQIRLPLNVYVAFPVNLRVHRKDDKKNWELAEEMILHLVSLFPNRKFKLVCDGAYAILAGRGLPQTHVTSRIRRDARIYGLPPTKREKGKRGPHPKKGHRLLSPRAFASQLKENEWTLCKVNKRGQLVDYLLWCQAVLWWETSKSPILLVIVRDPTGKQPDDFFFTTDTSSEPTQVVADYIIRWPIEETFRNAKQFLRAEDPQSWKKLGPERACGLAFLLYSLVWFWFADAKTPSPAPYPWYPKKGTPSFADAMGALRKQLWSAHISSLQFPSDSPSIQKLIEVLAQAV
ncbi:transposase [Candidatus Igneacidithiobacillus taiwanensis]|uniref:IS701 family transposase n=1 Tax=Candidatus Igneacidithiobacillus taiwanensis TaxID=1945924 RepID=UPI002899D783|nr:transposase [Candidatus Igneacidithiobacillus taiwanensis]